MKHLMTGSLLAGLTLTGLVASAAPAVTCDKEVEGMVEFIRQVEASFPSEIRINYTLKVKRPAPDHPPEFYTCLKTGAEKALGRTIKQERKDDGVYFHIQR